MLTLHPEDPCPYCGSVWSPHRCPFEYSPTRRHARREPDVERHVRDSIADELRMRCGFLRHPNPCPYCGPILHIVEGDRHD